MKVIGIVIFLSGLFFTLIAFFYDQELASPSQNWAPWIGILVLITGGITFFKARKED